MRTSLVGSSCRGCPGGAPWWLPLDGEARAKGLGNTMLFRESPTPKTPRTGRGSGGDASPSSSSPARRSSPWQPDDIQHLSEVDVQEAKKAVMFIFTNELLPIFPIPGEQCLNNYARHALVSAVILIIVVTRSPCSSPLPRSVRLDLTSSRFVRTRPSPPFWIG